MFMAGLGTATPPTRYSQSEGWEALQRSTQFKALEPRARAILKKVLTGNNGIRTRHLALDSLDQAFVLDADTLHQRFLKHAPSLATEAAQQALSTSGHRAEAIDAVVISTCTGYLCPGLTSYVSERLNLRPDALGLDLVGQGCAAALPNLHTAAALIGSGRARRVLSICVEICSAAFYLDNDPGVLISACLFGDGAGAAVLAAEPNGGRRVKWERSGSLLQPGQRDLLRFEQRGGMLRNILNPTVPALAAQHARSVLQSVLRDGGLTQGQIRGWMLHPGGRDVLTALGSELGLTTDDLRWSAEVLENYGNLSSASLYFVLSAALRDSAPGGYWWLSSFGAGFSCHGALLQVEE